MLNCRNYHILNNISARNYVEFLSLLPIVPSVRTMRGAIKGSNNNEVSSIYIIFFIEYLNHYLNKMDDYKLDVSLDKRY